MKKSIKVSLETPSIDSKKGGVVWITFGGLGRAVTKVLGKSSFSFEVRNTGLGVEYVCIDKGESSRRNDKNKFKVMPGISVV